MRTTVDIDDAILAQLKRLQRDEGTSLGRLISELLAVALSHRSRKTSRGSLQWTAREMKARYDLSDSGAILDAMDAPEDDAR